MIDKMLFEAAEMDAEPDHKVDVGEPETRVKPGPYSA